MLEIRSQTQNEVKPFVQSMMLLILHLGLESRPPGCELLEDKEHSLFRLWLQHPVSCLENSRCLMNECMSTLSSFHCLGQHRTASQQYYIGFDHFRHLNWIIRALWFRLGLKSPAVKIDQSSWQLLNCFDFVQYWHKLHLFPELVHCSSWLGITHRHGPDILLLPFLQKETAAIFKVPLESRLYDSLAYPFWCHSNLQGGKFLFTSC